MFGKVLFLNVNFVILTQSSMFSPDKFEFQDVMPDYFDFFPSLKKISKLRDYLVNENSLSKRPDLDDNNVAIDSINAEGILHYKIPGNFLIWKKAKSIENNYRDLITMKYVKYISQRGLFWRTCTKEKDDEELKITCYKCLGTICNNVTDVGTSQSWVKQRASMCPYEIFFIINHNDLCGLNYEKFNEEPNKSCPMLIDKAAVEKSCENPLFTKWRFARDHNVEGSERWQSGICRERELCDIFTSYEIEPDQITFKIIRETKILYSRVMRRHNQNFVCVDKCGFMDFDTFKVLKVEKKVLQPRAKDRVTPAKDHLAPAKDHLAPAKDTLAPAKDPLAPAKDHLAPAKDSKKEAADIKIQVGSKTFLIDVNNNNTIRILSVISKPKNTTAKVVKKTPGIAALRASKDEKEIKKTVTAKTNSDINTSTKTTTGPHITRTTRHANATQKRRKYVIKKFRRVRVNKTIQRSFRSTRKPKTVTPATKNTGTSKFTKNYRRSKQYYILGSDVLVVDDGVFKNISSKQQNNTEKTNRPTNTTVILRHVTRSTRATDITSKHKCTRPSTTEKRELLIFEETSKEARKNYEPKVSDEEDPEDSGLMIPTLPGEGIKTTQGTLSGVIAKDDSDLTVTPQAKMIEKSHPTRVVHLMTRSDELKATLPEVIQTKTTKPYDATHSTETTTKRPHTHDIPRLFSSYDQIVATLFTTQAAAQRTLLSFGTDYAKATSPIVIMEKRATLKTFKRKILGKIVATSPDTEKTQLETTIADFDDPDSRKAITPKLQMTTEKMDPTIATVLQENTETSTTPIGNTEEVTPDDGKPANNPLSIAPTKADGTDKYVDDVYDDTQYYDVISDEDHAIITKNNYRLIAVPVEDYNSD